MGPEETHPATAMNHGNAMAYDPENDPFARQRADMIDLQLVPRHVREPRVLAAMQRVPRHLFVPASNRALAYVDGPVSIGEGQTISQPLMVALMTELLELRGDERVLEVGTGSGYQTAILAELAGRVFTVERLEPLSRRAREVLSALGYKNVCCFVGDGTLGYPPEAPYDAAMVTAGGPSVPESVVSQLREGGRLVMPVGGRYEQLLVRGIRRDGVLHEERSTPCAFVPLVGAEGWEK